MIRNKKKYLKLEKYFIERCVLLLYYVNLAKLTVKGFYLTIFKEERVDNTCNYL